MLSFFHMVKKESFEGHGEDRVHGTTESPVFHLTAQESCEEQAENILHETTGTKVFANFLDKKTIKTTP